MKKALPQQFAYRAALPTWRQAAVALAVTLTLSWVMAALSRTPFLSVLLRLGFIGTALLFAFTGASAIRLTWLPQGLIRLLAVALAAPLATLFSYLLTEVIRGSDSVQKARGYMWAALLAMVIGIVVALVALRFERRARERALRLQVENERNTLERELLDARLRLLQAQIEPHFLFNTLANIQALVESGSANAAPVLRHLIAYLRAAMPRLNEANPTLGGELQLVRAYLELMHMRMPDRLRFTVEAPARLNRLAFPAMALLTLVENAVRHGIDPSTTGGSIAVSAEYDTQSGKVSVSVTDTGVGMAESSEPGTGLTNLRTRLLAFFGPEARLELHEAQPQGLHVTLVFHPRTVP